MSRNSEIREFKVQLAQAARDGINDFLKMIRAANHHGAAVCCLDGDDRENNTVQINMNYHGNIVVFEFTVRELFGRNV